MTTSMAPVDETGPVRFNVYDSYRRILSNEKISTPLAAMLALTELIENSSAGTMFELVQALHEGAEELRKRFTNSISINAGCELFVAFVTLFPHEASNFQDLKVELVEQGRQYATEAMSYREKIAKLALGFIKDGSVILTHSHSRVVVQALLLAHREKRISVYCTEARPRGLGAAGIPCTVILDSAVAYTMDKVDMVLVGSEAVVESGGLINAVGSNQMAIIAKAANVPVYAMAESYKFHRLFPLSQYDLPTHTPDVLSFPRQTTRPSVDSTIARPSVLGLPGLPNSLTRSKLLPTRALLPTQSSSHTLSTSEYAMSDEQIRLNPEVDYTRPDLISLVFSDVGILTPEGVSQYLVGMFAG